MRDAVIADCKAYNKMGDVNYPLAAKYLVDIDGGHTVKYMGGRALDLCRRVWNVFYTEGRVGEAWRRGAAPLISREDALKIAAQLKGGKQGYTIRGGRRWPRLVYYCSMEQAIHEDHDLQALQEKYNATPAQMLAAAKHHDPDLQRRTITYHPDFTAQQLADRVAKGAELLSMMPADPGSRQHLLDKFMWADEGSILLSDNNLSRLKVWCSAANFNLHDIVSLPQMQGQRDCKVRFFIVVSSHQGFAHRGGVVYWEFTTGTDYIRRVHNTLGQTAYEPFCYTVSTSALRNTMLPY